MICKKSSVNMDDSKHKKRIKCHQCSVGSYYIISYDPFNLHSLISNHHEMWCWPVLCVCCVRLVQQSEENFGEEGMVLMLYTC